MIESSDLPNSVRLIPPQGQGTRGSPKAGSLVLLSVPPLGVTSLRSGFVSRRAVACSEMLSNQGSNSSAYRFLACKPSHICGSQVPRRAREGLKAYRPGLAHEGGRLFKLLKLLLPKVAHAPWAFQLTASYQEDHPCIRENAVAASDFFD